jgi:Na+-driven multidrug efflux pump
MGAAMATIISQFCMLVWQINFFSNKKRDIYLDKKSFKLDAKIVKDSLLIGTAPFLMNSVSSIIVIVFNQGLIRHGGDLAVGAYGIINRFAALFVMVIMGITQGMQPIAGYNFGARNMARVNQVLKYSIVYATIIVSIGFVIGELFPRQVASVFTTDKELIEIVVPGMRVVFAMFPIIGFQMVTSNFFQSIGHPGKAIFMSLSRQVIFLLPFLFLFPSVMGIKGVWISIPAADLMSSMVASYMLFVEYRKLINKTSKPIMQ